MNIVGLFSGIGGLELPFKKAGADTLMLCEIWDAAQSVLRAHFPSVPIHEDIQQLKSLPASVDLVTAGFPCTDLSQAVRTAGIKGKESGLVRHVFRLLKKNRTEWLVLENVQNMLVLDGGRAMGYLVKNLEELKYHWAYRLVDSRSSGVPHRRNRVLFVASKHHDPREVLFADEAGEPSEHRFLDDAFGFYWTEGLTGLGWARDAVPPLKGGSTVGIPSPPAIWVPGAPHGQRIVVPSIEDAEALQGFSRRWTAPAQLGKKKGPRWKLVGNAATVGVSRWLAQRIKNPGTMTLPSKQISSGSRWPKAAYGGAGDVWAVEASSWPISEVYKYLSELIDLKSALPLSSRATAGFLERTTRSKLRFQSEFLEDLREHLRHVEPPAPPMRKAG